MENHPIFFIFWGVSLRCVYWFVGVVGGLIGQRGRCDSVFWGFNVESWSGLAWKGSSLPKDDPKDDYSLFPCSHVLQPEEELRVSDLLELWVHSTSGLH